MALFKIFKGDSSKFKPGEGQSSNIKKAKEGFAYFTTDDGKFYIDVSGDGTSDAVIRDSVNPTGNRVPLNAYKADIATVADKATKDKNENDIDTSYWSLKDGIEITSSENLNSSNYKRIGNYYCNLDSIAQSIVNLPIESSAAKAFILKVSNAAGTAHVKQDLYFYDSGQHFSRTYINDSWGIWQLYPYISSNSTTQVAPISNNNRPVYANQYGEIQPIRALTISAGDIYSYVDNGSKTIYLKLGLNLTTEDQYNCFGTFKIQSSVEQAALIPFFIKYSGGTTSSIVDLKYTDFQDVIQTLDCFIYNNNAYLKLNIKQQYSGIWANLYINGDTSYNFITEILKVAPWPNENSLAKITGSLVNTLKGIAEKAISDNEGNNIASTYLKKIDGITNLEWVATNEQNSVFSLRKTINNSTTSVFNLAINNPTLSWNATAVIATIGTKDISVKMPANPNRYRPIQVNSSAVLTNTQSTALNLIAGDNISLSNDGGNITINAEGNTDRYINSATFTNVAVTAAPIKMTLTRAGSDTVSVTASIPKVSATSAGVAPAGKSISTFDQSSKFLRSDGTWATPKYTTSLSWDNISNKPEVFYSLPVASSTTLGGIKIGYSSSNTRDYAIQLDVTTNQAYVNVPWTDTNVDKNVEQGTTITSSWRKILLNSVTNTSGADVPTTHTGAVYSAVGVEVQPSTGTLKATKLSSSSLSVSGTATFDTIPTAPTAASGDQSTKLATTEFVYNAFAANDAMVFKGLVSSNTALPATHKQGWTYKVADSSTHAGQTCEAGDTIYCITDGTTAKNSHWVVVQNNIDVLPIAKGGTGKNTRVEGYKALAYGGSFTGDIDATNNETGVWSLGSATSYTAESIKTDLGITTLPDWALFYQSPVYNTQLIVDGKSGNIYLRDREGSGTSTNWKTWHVHKQIPDTAASANKVNKSLTLTLNNTTKTFNGSTAQSATWYAPTSGGTQNFVLMAQGTTQTPEWHSFSDLINTSTTGTSDSEPTDYLISQYAGGNSSTNANAQKYYRREVQKVVNNKVVKLALGTNTDTRTFLRRDGTWSNILGSVSDTASTSLNIYSGTAYWAYVRLASSSTTKTWDIAFRSDTNSGALSFRYNSTNKVLFSQNGDISLIASNTNSPSLIFSRGTNSATDTYVDWKQQVISGALNFSVAEDASTWRNKVNIASTGLVDIYTSVYSQTAIPASNSSAYIDFKDSNSKSLMLFGGSKYSTESGIRKPGASMVHMATWGNDSVSAYCGIWRTPVSDTASFGTATYANYLFWSGGGYVANNIAPFQTSQNYNLGTTNHRWNTGFFSTYVRVGANDTTASTTNDNAVTLSSGGVFVNNSGSNTNSYGYFLRQGGSNYAKLFINTVGTGVAAGLTILQLGQNSSTTSARSRGQINLYGSTNTNKVSIYGSTYGYLTLWKTDSSIAYTNNSGTTAINFWNITQSGEKLRFYTYDPSTGSSSTTSTMANFYFTEKGYIEAKYSLGTSAAYGKLLLSTAGTTSVTGYAELHLGNNTPTGTAGNGRGRIYLYGSGTAATVLYSNLSSTASRSVYFPNYEGTAYLTHVSTTAIVGATNQPVYVAANGKITAITGVVANTAASANKVNHDLTLTLNNSAKTFNGSAVQSATWYAPTTGGTANYVLVAAGTTATPTWKAIAWSAWTAGTTAGPKANITIGTTTYTSAAIPIASTTQSGVVTTTAQSFVGVKTFSTTTDSSSVSTGTVIIKGGLGVAKKIYASAVYGAVWNDYAEFRQAENNVQIKPGKVVKETGNDTLKLTEQRLERGCNIVSDTFGFAIGETKQAKLPIAVSGRVLVYPYEDKEEFKNHIGWPVCSGPDGTVSIMTEEEEIKYPSRIIGTISAVPDYAVWHGGEDVIVDGRVWIKVR